MVSGVSTVRDARAREAPAFEVQRGQPTIGDIARRNGVPIHRVAYIIDACGIEPVGRAGHAYVYSEADVERIASELRRIAAAKGGAQYRPDLRILRPAPPRRRDHRGPNARLLAQARAPPRGRWKDPGRGAARPAAPLRPPGRIGLDRASVAGPPKALNRQTLDFIREGAAEGDRHRLLFSAAANLAEFECPPSLAHALLTEAALDSGLPPKEVHRQIECGLAAKGAPHA